MSNTLTAVLGASLQLTHLDPKSLGRFSGRTSRIGTVRALLLLQIAVFVSAASMHFGVLFEGYRHRTAGTAESLIAVVLLAGLAVTCVPSSWVRRAAIGAQAFGMVGVLVGLFTIAIGVGPRTGIDLAFHAAMLTLLIVGLAITVRASSKPPTKSGSPGSAGSCAAGSAIGREP